MFSSLIAQILCLSNRVASRNLQAALSRISAPHSLAINQRFAISCPIKRDAKGITFYCLFMFASAFCGSNVVDRIAERLTQALLASLISDLWTSQLFKIPADSLNDVNAFCGRERNALFANPEFFTPLEA